MTIANHEAKLNWTNNGGGVWSLPATIIPAPDGDISIGAIWTDEDGLQVTFEGSEGMIPAPLVAKIAAIMTVLSFQGPPAGAGAAS